MLLGRQVRTSSSLRLMTRSGETRSSSFRGASTCSYTYTPHHHPISLSKRFPKIASMCPPIRLTPSFEAFLPFRTAMWSPMMTAPRELKLVDRETHTGELGSHQILESSPPW